MNGKLLTVIVPIYNTERYLEECINSIIAQTYQPVEIILVDDGSTDSSPQICDKYSSYSNIKVIHKPNGGLISARKTGVNVATGEYIGFVDADDWIELDMYGYLMNEASMHSADIVSCGYYLDKGDSRRTVRGTDEKKEISSPEERKELFDGILSKGFDWTNHRNITPSVCNKIFRKSLLDTVYSKIDDRIIWDEDTVTTLSATLNSECIVLIPNALYHYRQNMSSMSHKVNRSVLQNYVYTFNELYRISSEHNGILDDQIPYFSLTAMRLALEVGFGVESGKLYLFPFDKIRQGCKVIIYGAGQVGRSYYDEVSPLDYLSKAYITDSNPDNWKGDVISSDEAFSHDYDVVLIAVENDSTAGKIKADLASKGIQESKLLWQKPVVLKDSYSFRARQDNRKA